MTRKKSSSVTGCSGDVKKLKARIGSLEKALASAINANKLLKARHKKTGDRLKEIQHSQQEIIQRERLHALGQMASGIVHDFNNALTPVLGASDFLISHPTMLDDREETLVLLGSVRTAARDAKNVVRRLREFYHPSDEAEITAVDVNPLAEEVVLLTQPRWREQAKAQGIAIDMHLALEHVPPIHAAKSQLREVFTNLILNSIDAMPKGGSICLGTHAEEDMVVIRVTDTGCGMPPEIAQHCFEPFFSTKGKNGTGLGLSIAYGIVQRFRGSIKVRSVQGEGTTITIRLPISETAIEPADDAATHNVPASQPLKIMVVNENALSRDIIIKHIASDGHQVVGMADGKEALARCTPGMFDLVVLGRVLPGMSGLQVAESLKRKVPALRIVLLTGYSDPLENEKDSCKHIDVVVAKPVTQIELRRAIHKAMEKK